MAMYDDQMERAFSGMKADSGDDRVESFPVGTNGLGFGLVTGTDAGGLLVPGAGTKVRGISLASHTAVYRTGAGVNQYGSTECASVMTRGLVWAKVTAAGAVTEDGPVKFAAAGTVADGDATVLANAVFRSGLVAVTGGNIALVELHNPFSETDTVA